MEPGRKHHRAAVFADEGHPEGCSMTVEDHSAFKIEGCEIRYTSSPAF